MSKNENPMGQLDASNIVDDWENIASEQVQQLTNERLTLAEQQQRTNVVEQQFMNEAIQDEDGGLPASMVNKPIKILRREQPLLNRVGDKEAKDEAALLEKLTLDERKANYDKIRERIFNAANSEDKDDVKSEASKKSPKKEITDESEATTSSEVMIETINHLSNVQMLSEQTAKKIRPPPAMMPPPPLWFSPHNPDIRNGPPFPFMTTDVNQPMGVYGLPPPQPMRYVPPPNFTRPPPSLPNAFPQNLQSRRKFNP